MRGPAVYIAGVGQTHIQDPSSSVKIHDALISAGTKAMLDAGVTYGEVNQSVACFLDQDLKVDKTSFDTYGKTGTPVCEVDCYSGLYVGGQFVKSGHSNCVLVVGFDKVYSSLLRRTPTLFS